MTKEPQTIVVKLFPNGKVHEDGNAVSIDVLSEDGSKYVLTMPFSQLDWLQQALLSLSRGAYERQVASGRLPGTTNVVEAQSMIVESLRAMVNPATKKILVQMSGRTDPNEPPGMGSFVLDEEGARHLSMRLSECAEQLRQTSKPS